MFYSSTWCSKVHVYILQNMGLSFQDCQEVKCIAPGSTNAVKLSRFFDKVSIAYI